MTAGCTRHPNVTIAGCQTGLAGLGWAGLGWAWLGWAGWAGLSGEEETV